MVKGSIVALVTPFNEDGSVNLEKIGELIEYHIANKTDGIVLLGTTAESPTLTFEEEEQILEYAVKKAAGRIFSSRAAAQTAHRQLSKEARLTPRRALTLCLSSLLTTTGQTQAA